MPTPEWSTTDASGNFSLTTNQASLGMVYAVTTDGQGHTSNTATAMIAVTAPVVTLSVQAIGPDLVALSGTLTDVDAASQTITLAGAVQDTVVTDANGNFTYVTGSVTGEIEASTTDLWGHASNMAEVTVGSYTAPEITLNAEVLTGHQVQLTGAVTDAQPSGVTVTFSGAASGSTTTDGNGDFSFTTSQASLGTVYAVGLDEQQMFTDPASACVIAVERSVLKVSGQQRVTQDDVTPLQERRRASIRPVKPSR